MGITIEFTNMCDLEKFKLLFVETYCYQLESLPIRIYDKCIYMELHVEKFNYLSFPSNTNHMIIYNYLKKPEPYEQNPTPYYAIQLNNLPANLKRCTIMSIEKIICDNLPNSLIMLDIAGSKINLDRIPKGVLILKINANLCSNSFIDKNIVYNLENVVNLPRTLTEIYFYNDKIAYNSVDDLINNLFNRK